MVGEIPGQLGTAFLAASPPSLLLFPSLLAGGRVRNRGSLDAVQHCWAKAKPLVCYQHWFSHKSKPQFHMGCYENVNSIPGRSSTILLPTRRTWALNLAYSCLVSFPGFIICPEQMTYLLSEAAMTNSPEITASLKWKFLLVASKLLQLTCYLQHPLCLGPPWTRSQRSSMIFQKQLHHSCRECWWAPSWSVRKVRAMKVSHHIPPFPPL